MLTEFQFSLIFKINYVCDFVSSRLPTTPEGERKPRPGERLVSMDGSPVCIDKDQANVITLAVGKRVCALQYLVASQAKC